MKTSRTASEQLQDEEDGEKRRLEKDKNESGGRMRRGDQRKARTTRKPERGRCWRRDTGEEEEIEEVTEDENVKDMVTTRTIERTRWKGRKMARMRK